MIYFFGDASAKVFAVQTHKKLSQEDTDKLIWLFACPDPSARPAGGVSGATDKPLASLDAFFIGPRAAMITPWSTNATEITQNMGISGIIRIEEFQAVKEA